MNLGKKIGLVFKIAVPMLLAIVIYSMGFVNGYERAGTLSASYPKRMRGALLSVVKMVRCKEYDRAEKVLTEISEFANFYAEQVIKDAKRPNMIWLASSPTFFFVGQNVPEELKDSVSPSGYACDISMEDERFQSQDQ